MPALRNTQHEKFAVLRAMGWRLGKAWKDVTGNHGATTTAYETGSEWARRKDVAARIRELQEAAADQATWTKAKLIAYLESVLETPAAGLDPDSPLVEEIYATAEGMRMKVMSKLGAAQLLAKLCGWEAPEKREVSISGSEEIDAALRALLG